MKIHLLTPRIPDSPDSALKASLDLLKAAAEKQEHRLELIETKDCKMLFNGRPHVIIRNIKPKIKVLITRPSFSYAQSDTHATLIRQFELLGIKTINNYNGIIDAKNKIRMLQKLSRGRIPMPKSYVVHSAEFLNEMVDDIGNYPVILKNVGGSGGIGVAIAESKRALKSILEMMIEGEGTGPLIVQEYIREARGKDIRVFIVGGKIIGAMERIVSEKGEFRSNFSIGGKVRITELSTEEKRLAKRATKAMELDIAGVDIVRTYNGPKVLEVNSNPGLKGITQATGRDIAGAIIKFAVKKCNSIG